MPPFRRLSARLVAVLYTGGSFAHLARLAVDFSWRDMPFFIDWVVVGLGGAGCAGYVRHFREIAYRGAWEKAVHWLMVAHLAVSVVFHLWALAAGSHRMFRVFAYEYSFFALAFFSFFAWRAWTLRFRYAEPAG